MLLRSTSRLMLAALVPVVLTACAVDNQYTATRGLGLTYRSDVKALPDGNFFVEAEAAPLAGRQGGARAVVNERAQFFCSERKKSVSVIKNETDSHLLVNGVARLTFACV